VPLPRLILIAACLGLLSCSIIETTYDLTVGKFTFTVVMAPLSWPLTNDDIETIDGLPPNGSLCVRQSPTRKTA
jgi:hypothetical protein